MLTACSRELARRWMLWWPVRTARTNQYGGESVLDGSGRGPAFALPRATFPAVCTDSSLLTHRPVHPVREPEPGLKYPMRRGKRENSGLAAGDGVSRGKKYEREAVRSLGSCVDRRAGRGGESGRSGGSGWSAEWGECAQLGRRARAAQ